MGPNLILVIYLYCLVGYSARMDNKDPRISFHVFLNRDRLPVHYKALPNRINRVKFVPRKMRIMNLVFSDNAPNLAAALVILNIL